MLQQGKGGMGLGGLGGGAQMLFGGSGGQDVFQKTTWVLAALFMLGSFGLTLMKSKGGESSRYLRKVEQQQNAPVVENIPAEAAQEEMPAQTESTEQEQPTA